MPAPSVVCPCCGSTLDRDTVRPPCANGCRTPEGFRRLSDAIEPAGQRPVCAACYFREQGEQDAATTPRRQGAVR